MDMNILSSKKGSRVYITPKKQMQGFSHWQSSGNAGGIGETSDYHKTH